MFAVAHLNVHESSVYLFVGSVSEFYLCSTDYPFLSALGLKGSGYVLLNVH